MPSENRSYWPFSSFWLRLASTAAIFASSPGSGLNAALGMPVSISAGVVPSRELPTRMLASRNGSGLPGSTDSSHSDTLASSAAISLTSTP